MVAFFLCQVLILPNNSEIIPRKKYKRRFIIKLSNNKKLVSLKQTILMKLIQEYKINIIKEKKKT